VEINSEGIIVATKYTDIDNIELPNLVGKVVAIVFMISAVMLIGQLFQDHHREVDILETSRIYTYQQQLAYAGQTMNSLLQLQTVSNDVERDSLERLIKSSFHGLKYTTETLNELSNELDGSDKIPDEEQVISDYVELLIIQVSEIMALLESSSAVDTISNTQQTKASSLYDTYQREVTRVIEYLSENLIEKSTQHRYIVWWIVLIVLIIICVIGFVFYRFSRNQVHQQFDALSKVKSQLKAENDLRKKKEGQLVNQSKMVISEHMKLQSILGSTVDAIITITTKGVVDSFNKAAEKMFGYPAEYVIGKNVKILMPEPFISEHDGYLKNYNETGDKKIIGSGREVIAKRIDGSVFPIFLSVSEVEGTNPKLFTGIVQDITKRKESDRKLQHAMTELKEKQAELEYEEQIATQVFENITKQSNDDIPELTSWNQPMMTFSGDMMLSAILPSGGIRVILCDFTGHGLPAALGAIPVSSIHNTMAKKGLPLDVLMNEMNNKLKELLPADIFCCVTVVDLDATRTFARIWNAGLPEGLLVSQSGEIKQRFTSNHLPLGIMKYSIDEIQSEEIHLEHGDMIYIYSDGVTEAENEAGEMLGQQGFEALLAVKTDDDGRLNDVKNKVASFVGEAAATDDISIIEIKTLVTMDGFTLKL